MTKIHEKKILEGKKDDARILRSKRDLSEALVSLLEEKPYNSISVKDICEKAMISKLCFYNNFLNKDDLMVHLFKKVTNENLNKIGKSLSKTNQEKSNYEDIILKLIQMFYDEKGIFRKVISSDKNKSLYSIIQNYIKETIPSLLSYSIPSSLSYIPNDIVISYFSGALTGILYNMSEDNDFLNNKNISDYIGTLTTSTLLSFRLK